MIRIDAIGFLKRRWQHYTSLSTFKKIIVGAAFLSLVLATVSISYLSLSFALISREELNLAALAAAWDASQPCHEDCAAAKRQAAQDVIADLQSGRETRASRRLAQYVQSETEFLAFRKALVRILAAAYGSNEPPSYLKDYFLRSGANAVIQAEILRSFSPQSLGLVSAGDASAGVSPLDAYLAVLDSSGGLSLRLAAVGTFSLEPDKKNNFSANQLAVIRDLILASATPNRLRQSLILLSGDYFPFFPSDTELIWRIVYDSGAGGDEVSRAFSADLLNRLAGAKLKIPEVSAAAWAEYYND